MTEVEAAKLITVLVTAWPEGMRWLGPEQQAETRAMYRGFLLDFDYQPADAAVRRLIATWKPTSARGWPSIAELRGAIATQVHGRTQTAGAAWGLVRKLKSPRPAAEWRELDPVFAAVLDQLGWVVWDDVASTGERMRRWRVVPGDNEAADRARFVEWYDAMRGREASEKVSAGICPPIQTRRLGPPSVDKLGDILARLPAPKSEE